MLFRDLIHASRGLRKSPSFTLTSIATIALGIGASTAIFSVVNGVLLRPLPYRDPSRLVLIESDMRHRNVVDFPFSPPDFDDLRRGSTLMEDVSAVVTFRQVISTDEGEPEQIRMAQVAPNFFGLVGAHIEQGRDFTSGDATPIPPPTPGQAAPQNVPGIAIISHEYWQRRFGRDPHIVGRSIKLGGGKATIVGVLEPGFELLYPARAGVERSPDLWQALRVDFATADRNGVFLHPIGRLKPGVTAARAQGQADEIAEDIRRRFPIKGTAGLYFRVEPMQDGLVASVRPAISALIGAVIILMLIACANAGNLMLVRSFSRSRELAVRAALGGGRWDLVRQMLAETLLIAFAGAMLGVALARGGLDLLLAFAPANFPRLNAITLDPTALAFAALAALLAAILFGVIPALRASRPDIGEVLKASSRTSGLGRVTWMRNGIVVLEVMLSFVLLIGSGLMLRSFITLATTDPGYDSHGILTFSLPPATARTPQEREAFMNEVRRRLQGLTGVKAVTSSLPLPLDGSNFRARWGLADALTDPSHYHQANNQFVTPGYFETFHTRLIAGRTFTDADNVLDRKVMVIDRILAAKAFPRQSAVGQRLLVRVTTPEPEWYEVIGVVDHQRNETLLTDGPEVMYFTDACTRFGTATDWILRTEGDPQRLVSEVRTEIARYDKRLAVAEFHPMDYFVDRAQAQTRFALVLIGIFAAMAALLSAVGLYGVLASAVRQRTAEIGLRMALGAPPMGIFTLVVWQGLRLSAAGIVLGAIAAIGLTRLISTLLVGIKPTDPATFGAMAALFLAISAIASGMPARRAASLDPTVALREE